MEQDKKGKSHKNEKSRLGFFKCADLYLLAAKRNHKEVLKTFFTFRSL